VSHGLLETWRGVVYPAELDHMGHMNVQYYTAKFDQGTWQLFNQVGLSNRFLRDNKRGMAAVDQHTRYLAEVMAGDVLVVKSTILEIRDKVIRFRHQMYNLENAAATEVANSELIAVYMDLAVRKSCPFPAAIVQNCQAVITAAQARDQRS